MKCVEVDLKAYTSVLEARGVWKTTSGSRTGLRPHEALGYRTPAEAFHGEKVQNY